METMQQFLEHYAAEKAGELIGLQFRGEQGVIMGRLSKSEEVPAAFEIITRSPTLKFDPEWGMPLMDARTQQPIQILGEMRHIFPAEAVTRVTMIKEIDGPNIVRPNNGNRIVRPS